MKSVKLALLAFILAFAFAPAQASEPIRIGVIGPFTGGSDAMGVSMLRGIRLAADEINKAGGVLGRRLVLIARDDQANNDRGAQIAAELTEKRQIDAAVGIVNTGVALAALPYFQEARIPLVLSVTTGSQLTQQFAPPEYAENYIFRVSFSTAVEVEKIVEIVKARGYRKIAIFADTTAYGQVGRHDLISNAVRKRHHAGIEREIQYRRSGHDRAADARARSRRRCHFDLRHRSRTGGDCE